MNGLQGVRACVFDAYGTLFDFASAAAACEGVPADRRAALTALWRDKQLQYSWLRSLQGRYVDFWRVTGDALDYALDSLGLAERGLRERLMGLYRRSAVPEVPRRCAALRGAGLRPPSSPTARPTCSPTRWRRRGSRAVRRRAVGRCGRRLQDHPSVYQYALDGSASPAAEVRSSRPTPGTPTRRRTSACASSGATARPAPRAPARRARFRDPHPRRAAGAARDRRLRRRSISSRRLSLKSDRNPA